MQYRRTASASARIAIASVTVSAFESVAVG